MTNKHKMDFISTVACLLAFAVIGVANAKDDFTREEVRKIEEFVGDVMGCGNIPGLSMGVVRGDATKATGLGVADMDTAHPVDNRTIFNLGSTAKAFVPYVLAEIMNGRENRDGRETTTQQSLPMTADIPPWITWNSTLREILRHDLELEVPLPWADITLKDMLIYPSGSSAADMATMAGMPSDVTREELIKRIRFLPDTKDFRQTNHYSNFMYTIAGHLAERMSGMSWAELVKARVLDKQYMNTSSFAPKGMTSLDAALPYRYHATNLAGPFVEQNMTLFDLHPFEPVGSLMASAEDITKWLRHLVHNLHVKGNDSGINMLIGDAFHQWVTVPADQPEGMIRHDTEVALGYGMGWHASTYHGLRRYRYAGSLYGYASQIWLFPEVKSAIFVAINGPGSEHAKRALDAIMYQVSDITLRRSPWITMEIACCCHDMDYDYTDYYDVEEEESAPAEQKKIDYLAPVEKYEGKYGNGLVGNLIVEANQAGVLSIKLGRNLQGELTADGIESRMKFLSTSWLLNTEEWCTEKKVEFLYATEGMNHGDQPYDIVRVYLNVMESYDFRRDKLFETVLEEAEEEERKKEVEEEMKVSNTHVHNEKTPDHTKTSYETVKPTEKDEEENNVDSYTKSSEEGENLQRDHDFSSNPHETEVKSDSDSSHKHEQKLDPDSHQSHQPYSIDDEQDLSRMEIQEEEKPDTGRKVREKNVRDSNPDNAGSAVQICSLLIFLSALSSIFITRV